MKVVVVLLFVMQLGALHFKLILVQQQNVVMCLTLNPWRRKKRVKEWEINQIFQDVWAPKLPWVEAMLGANGKVNMVNVVFACKLKVERRSWFPNSTTSKNMLGSTMTRLQNQIVMWGNITCLLNHNMQRMSDFSAIGEKTQWLTWLLWGMWLGGKKKVYTICCNFLAFETGLSYD
jgi:hypothetical protein